MAIKFIFPISISANIKVSLPTFIYDNEIDVL